MKKWLILLALSCFVSSVVAEDPETLLRTCVRVDCMNEGILGMQMASGGSGSGSIVRSTEKNGQWVNVVLTCRHVTEKKVLYAIRVPQFDDKNRFVKWSRHPAHLYSQSKAEDLSVLMFLSDQKMPSVTIGYEDEIHVGDRVKAIGSRWDFPRFDSGEVNAVFAEPYSFLIDCSSLPGDSGGAVLKKDRLVGLVKSIQGYENPPFNQLLPQYTNIAPIQSLEKSRFGFILDDAIDIPEFDYRLLRAKTLHLVEPPDLTELEEETSK